MKVLCFLLVILVCGGRCCEMQGPLDLGRPLSSSHFVTSPVMLFRQGNIQTADYYGYRYLFSDFCTGEHVGSHFDAPYHFIDSGWTVDQVPLNRLIANGVFLNVTDEVAGNHSFRLQPSHIDAWIERNGPFPDNAVLLVSYGWAQLYHNHTLYAGTNSTSFNDFLFPGISEEAVDRLAQISQLVGFGVDTPMIDHPGTAYAHATLAPKNVYNLEQVNLAPGGCLPEKNFKVISMPVNVVGGTGSPARIVAVPNSAV